MARADGVFRFVLIVAVLGGPLAAPTAAQVVTVPGNYSTIQAAVNTVPSGTTINVQPGTYAEALVVSIQNKSITVRGVSGAAATIVDAAGRNTTALHVLNSTGSIVFEGLTFRNGAQQGTLPGGAFLIQNASPAFVNSVFEASSAFDGGGGALFSSNATFTGVTIRNNSARRFGGGLYIVSGSRPVFTACDIASNASGTGGAGVANNGAGGGVFSHDSSPTFRGGLMRGNASKFAAGGIFHLGLYGSSFGVATMAIEDMQITDNVSVQFSAAESPAEGGGMHVEDNAVATLTRVQVLRNRANTGAGLNAYRARYDLVDTAIEGNVASPTSTDPNSGVGGGIAATANNVSTPLRPATIVTLTRTLVSNNTANGAGGGLAVIGDNFNPSIRATLAITGSVITGNRTQSQAGAILATRADVTVSNTLVTQNSVGGGANANGGGMQFEHSDVQISGTTIAANAAAQYGGGIFVNTGVNLSITTSRLYDNTAGTNGGGGLFVGAGTVSASVQNSIVADNTQYQIVEHKCPGSFTTFQGNTITPRSGSTDFYFNSCPQSVTSLTQFEALANTSGNNSNLPRFAHFLAAPAAGTRARLAWSVGRATAVTVSGVGTFNHATWSAEVSPASSTSYSLTATASSANGGNYPAITADVQVVPPPTARRRMVAGDFNGDGRADLTVFRPSNGIWYHWYTNTGAMAGVQWGNGNDVIVPGDFDGDQKVDLAVFRPSNGTWYFVNSSTGAAAGVQWGNSSDAAVPADYDGDGRTDIAVFRPSTGVWFIVNSSTGGAIGVQWGNGNDRPVPADYNGDGKADIAVFRPSDGVWYIRYSSGGSAGVPWGNSADIAVPGDYDGDGKTDMAVFRPSSGVWFIVNSSTGGTVGVPWGNGNDKPVPGDYDGDGKTDIAVFRPSTGVWFIVFSSTGVAAGYQWGNSLGIPVLKRP